LLDRSICHNKEFWAPLGCIPADSADGHEKVLAPVGFSVADCARPLMEEPGHNRGCIFAPNRRSEPQNYRHRDEIEEVPEILRAIGVA
jgi:hypothetical protein